MRSGASSRCTGRALPAAILCAAVFGLTACGGGDSSGQTEPTSTQAADIKAIDQLGASLAEAVNRGNASGICSRIEPAGVKEQFGTRKRCLKLLQAQFATLSTKPTFKLTTITIDGDTASAEQQDESLGRVNFVKVNNRWYVDLSPEEPTSGNP